MFVLFFFSFCSLLWMFWEEITDRLKGLENVSKKIKLNNFKKIMWNYANSPQGIIFILLRSLQYNHIVISNKIIFLYHFAPCTVSTGAMEQNIVMTFSWWQNMMTVQGNLKVHSLYFVVCYLWLKWTPQTRLSSFHWCLV